MSSYELPANGVLSIQSFIEAVRPTGTKILSNNDLAIIPSGFPELDHYIGGLRVGDFIVVGAKGGFGKAAFATTIAHHAATSRGVPSFIACFDSTFEDYVNRFIATEARADVSLLTSPTVPVSEASQFEAAQITLIKAPLTFFIDTNVHITQLRAKVIEWAEAHKQLPSLLIVDTLQFLKGSSRANDDSYLTEVVLGLKNLALELSGVVIAASKLNPSVKGYSPPTVEDLLGGAVISASADIILTLSPGEPFMPLTIAQNRPGQPSATIPVLFKPEWRRFFPAPSGASTSAQLDADARVP